MIEELDPFIEEQIKAMGIDVIGKEIFPYTNEFDPGVIQRPPLRGKKMCKINLTGCSDPTETAKSLSWLSSQRIVLCP